MVRLISRLKLVFAVLAVVSLWSPPPAVAQDGCHGESIVPGCTEYCQLGECSYHVCCGTLDNNVWSYCPGYGGFFENSCGEQDPGEMALE